MTATVDEVATGEPPRPDEPQPERRRRWPHRVLLAISVLAIVGAAVRVAVHDPTSLHVSGDQSAFTYQALSIAGGNLSYDAEDQAKWVELEWGEQPRGLFMQRRTAGGDVTWAFAKPYLYSLTIAGPLAAFGSYGITLVGGLLLLLYAWCWYAVGRTRWRPAPAAMVAAAATVASNAWPMAFPVHADLFVGVLTALVALGSVRLALGGPVDRDTGASAAVLSVTARVGWAVLAVAATGMLVTEKAPALVAVGPLLALALWRAPMRARVAAVVAGVVVVGLSVVPYLHYSDGASWNAYGGDRYYAPGSTPWSGGTIDNLVPWRTAESMSPNRVIEHLQDPSGDIPSAALTYVIGRHTGAVTHQPVVGTLAVAAGVAVWQARRRRAPGDSGAEGDVVPDDRVEAPAEPSALRPLVLGAAVLGLVGYVALYLISFTDNYFGGGQSVGNRYFLQISALVAVVPVAAGVRERVAMWAAAIGATLGVVLITPQLFQPEEAFYHLERTSPVQRWLPFDGSQAGNWRFVCDPDVDCSPPPVAPYPG